MKVVDIADEIYRDFSYPKDIDIPIIAYWIRTNLGQLNNALQTNYVYDETSLEVFEASTQEEIGESEKTILKKLFLIYFCVILFMFHSIFYYYLIRQNPNQP